MAPFGSFSVIFVSTLMLGSYWIQSHDATIAAGAAVVFSYWAFYIHRNDLLNQVNLEKRAILIWVACLVLSEFVRAVQMPFSERPLAQHRDIPG